MLILSVRPKKTRVFLKGNRRRKKKNVRWTGIAMVSYRGITSTKVLKKAKIDLDEQGRPVIVCDMGILSKLDYVLICRKDGKIVFRLKMSIYGVRLWNKLVEQLTEVNSSENG